MEVIHRKGISITLAVEPDIPQEKRIYDFRVTFQVSIEIENKTVVQRSLHTHFMKTFSKTMVVFNGVSVGLENIFVQVNLTGGIGSSLQQKIIVTVDTGNQASSQFLCIQRIHQHHFLALCQRSGGRKHHLEITLLILELSQKGTPESDVVIAFHIRHNTPAPFL